MHKAHRRRFGVEIECGMDGGVYEAGQLFQFPMRHDEWEGTYPDYERGDGWTVHEDGSGVELGSPILQGEEGFQTIRWAMDLLRNNGAWVSSYDGLHVHHDAPEFVENPRLCIPLIESWLNNENTIREFVDEERRDHGACPRWTERYLDRLHEWLNDPTGRAYAYFGRNDLNLLALSEHGTIEIRLLEGTLDADVAIAWIQFGQRLIHEVLQDSKPLEAQPTDKDLLSRLKLSPEARAILAAKQAAGHRTPGMNYRDYYDDEY